ncbi:hypothetical protein R3I93_003114 [Phoxinus phoxinus]|uniref:Uncharacterized protein n=1 Tax=Phoxinus phoxinus TaxID=58324 RepID=A0AAN9DH41_9TELE
MLLYLVCSVDQHSSRLRNALPQTHTLELRKVEWDSGSVTGPPFLWLWFLHGSDALQHPVKVFVWRPPGVAVCVP